MAAVAGTQETGKPEFIMVALAETRDLEAWETGMFTLQSYVNFVARSVLFETAFLDLGKETLTLTSLQEGTLNSCKE